MRLMTATAAAALLLAASAAFAQEAALPDTTAAAAADTSGGAMTDDQKIANLNHLLTLNPHNAALYNDLGVIYARRKQWVPARDAFIAAVQSDPKLAISHRNLGMVMVQLGQPELAESELAAYRKLSEDGGRDSWKLLGDARQQAGNVAGAREAYEKGLDAYGHVFGPQTADLVLDLVHLEEGAGEREAADRVVAEYAPGARDLLASEDYKLVDHTAEVARAVLDRALKVQTDAAQKAVDEKRYADAAADYERAMALDPTREDLLALAAGAWIDAGDAMKARVMAKRATIEHPDRPGGWRAMGRVAEAEKRPRDAIDAYTKAWDLDQSQNDVAAKIGSLYLKLGDNDGARRFMGAVASDPSTPPEILFNYALSLQRSGDHSLAVPPLRKVVERAPEMTDAWKALATSLRQLGRWSQAADAYAHALKGDADPKLAFQLGYCQGKAGRNEESVAAYKRAVDLDPTYVKAWNNLGVAQMKVKDYKGALDTYKTLALLDEDVYRARFNEGVCLYKLGRYEEALTVYEQALDLRETSAVWENMGLVQDKLGHKKDAADCFKEGKRLKEEGK